MSNGLEMLQQNFILFTISASENNEKSIGNCFVMVAHRPLFRRWLPVPSTTRRNVFNLHSQYALSESGRLMVPQKISNATIARTHWIQMNASTHTEDHKWLDVWPNDYFSLFLFASRHTKIEMESFNWMLCRHIYWLLNMCYSHTTNK